MEENTSCCFLLSSIIELDSVAELSAISELVSFQKHKEIALTSFGQFHHVFEN